MQSSCSVNVRETDVSALGVLVLDEGISRAERREEGKRREKKGFEELCRRERGGEGGEIL